MGPPLFGLGIRLDARNQSLEFHGIVCGEGKGDQGLNESPGPQGERMSIGIIRSACAEINKIVYTVRVKSSEFKRWLAAQGATFKPAKGSHLRVELNERISILPMHSKDLKKGLVAGIEKQLGLKEE
jgi:mRNA interferase HicA